MSTEGAQFRLEPFLHRGGFSALGGHSIDTGRVTKMLYKAICRMSWALRQSRVQKSAASWMCALRNSEVTVGFVDGGLFIERVTSIAT